MIAICCQLFPHHQVCSRYKWTRSEQPTDGVKNRGITKKSCNLLDCVRTNLQVMCPILNDSNEYNLDLCQILLQSSSEQKPYRQIRCILRCRSRPAFFKKADTLKYFNIDSNEYELFLLSLTLYKDHSPSWSTFEIMLFVRPTRGHAGRYRVNVFCIINIIANLSNWNRIQDID